MSWFNKEKAGIDKSDVKKIQSPRGDVDQVPGMFRDDPQQGY